MFEILGGFYWPMFKFGGLEYYEGFISQCLNLVGWDILQGGYTPLYPPPL